MFGNTVWARRFYCLGSLRLSVGITGTIFDGLYNSMRKEECRLVIEHSYSLGLPKIILIVHLVEIDVLVGCTRFDIIAVQVLKSVRILD